MILRLCLLSSISWLMAAQPLGEPLPALTGETLSSKQVELPAAESGRDRVLIFSFSKAAGADSRLWSEHLAKEIVVTFRVIVLESVPRLVRGMAVSGIRSGIPAAQRDHTLLVYKDEASWKKRLGVTNDKYSYVVLLDGTGRIRWIGAGPFTDATYAQLTQTFSPR
jgi:hypothetical protein